RRSGDPRPPDRPVAWESRFHTRIAGPGPEVLIVTIGIAPAEGGVSEPARNRVRLLWTEEEREVALDALTFPDFAVDALERCPRHGTHRHRVGKSLGLQIWVVREDPHMTELVSDNRLELVLVYRKQKGLLEHHPKCASLAVDSLHRNQQRVCRHDLGRDDGVDPELRLEAVHQLLKRYRVRWLAGSQPGGKTDEHGGKTQQRKEQAMVRLGHARS